MNRLIYKMLYQYEYAIIGQLYEFIILKAL
jgi:hypothetical protein